MALGPVELAASEKPRSSTISDRVTHMAAEFLNAATIFLAGPAVAGSMVGGPRIVSHGIKSGMMSEVFNASLSKAPHDETDKKNRTPGPTRMHSAKASVSRTTDRMTHHERILTELRDSITGGTWPPGFQLPFETQLAETYGVSRMTMNKVLSQLTREGYLIRRKKLGTVVAQPMAQAAVMEITDIATEVAALGLDWRFDLLEREIREPSKEEGRSAKITDPGRMVLSLRGVHHAGTLPFCHEARLINLVVAPAAATVDFHTVAPGAWLVREVPWTSASHRIRSVPANGVVARDLGLRPGTPCLEVTRRTEVAGQWVTLVAQTYPGDRHELVAEFGPNAVV